MLSVRPDISCNTVALRNKQDDMLVAPANGAFHKADSCFRRNDDFVILSRSKSFRAARRTKKTDDKETRLFPAEEGIPSGEKSRVCSRAAAFCPMRVFSYPEESPSETIC